MNCGGDAEVGGVQGPFLPQIQISSILFTKKGKLVFGGQQKWKEGPALWRAGFLPPRTGP
jgi:hypothetical protein